MTLKLAAGQFYGGNRRILDMNGVRLSERHYQGDLITPLHAHELAHFCYVLAGRYTERLGRRTEHRARSTLVWYPPGFPHAERHYVSGRHFLIELDKHKFEEWGTHITEPGLVLNGRSRWWANQLHSEFHWADDFSHLAIEGIILELVAAVGRAGGRGERGRAPRWLSAVEELLNENYVTPPNLATLAETAGVHPIHLSRTFRRWHKSTIAEYIRQLRIRKAAALIEGSDQPFAQIALIAGFADQSHFVKSFKRVTGMTPSQFRSLSER